MVGQIIVVEGNIGCGKTTFLNSIKHYYETILHQECRILYEPINTDFLNMYIRESKKYAFAFQVIIARDRKKLLYEALQEIQNKDITILIDRGLQGDRIFANVQKKLGYFTEEEYG